MPSIEFIVLANHAEVRDGLLFLAGGCWTDHWRGIQPGGPPPVSHLGIGAAVLVEWDETNRRHHLVLRLETDDGKEIAKVDGDLEMGRPTGIPAGSEQRAVIAINFDLQFPTPGGYRVVGQLGEQVKRVAFRVHDQPPPR